MATGVTIIGKSLEDIVADMFREFYGYSRRGARFAVRRYGEEIARQWAQGKSAAEIAASLNGLDDAAFECASLCAD